MGEHRARSFLLLSFFPSFFCSEEPNPRLGNLTTRLTWVKDLLPLLRGAVAWTVRSGNRSSRSAGQRPVTLTGVNGQGKRLPMLFVKND